MARKFDPEVAASVTESVRSIEASSSVEVVVEVRSQSGTYAHADGRFGALAAFVALLFVLFSPWTFDPIWVPVVVVFTYAAGFALSMGSNFLRRLTTFRREREQKVRTHAMATFVERGVANTERETGLLLYLSLLERRIELIADRGVLDAVPVLEWNQVLESAHARKATVSTILDVLRALQPLLTRYLAARADDRDELANDVKFVRK